MAWSLTRRSPRETVVHRAVEMRGSIVGDRLAEAAVHRDGGAAEVVTTIERATAGVSEAQAVTEKKIVVTAIETVIEADEEITTATNAGDKRSRRHPTPKIVVIVLHKAFKPSYSHRIQY